MEQRCDIKATTGVRHAGGHPDGSVSMGVVADLEQRLQDPNMLAVEREATLKLLGAYATKRV